MEATGGASLKFSRKLRVRLIQWGLLAALAGFSMVKAQSPANDEKMKLPVVSAIAIREAARFHVEPEYPAIARQFRLNGEVVADLTVGLDGKVETVQVTKGNPLLNTAVVSALKKWTFVPFNVDGRPTKVKSTLSFVFKL
jgi:TonB family protein